MWRAKSEWILAADAVRGGAGVRPAVARVAAGLLVIFGLVSACESASRGDRASKTRGATPSQPAAAVDYPGATPPADAQKTASGLVTRVLRPGRGDRTPKAYDKVRVHFIGWNHKGKRVEDTRARGKPATFDLTGVIAGWTQALQLMKVGEQRRVWVPDALSYPRPTAPRKPTVFDIELLEILDGPPPLPAPADVAAPPANALRTKSGLAYRWLERGGSGRKANPWDRVRLDYTGWTIAGEMFESSSRLGGPATFDVNEVIAGWAEVLPRMAVGDRMRLWVPEALAYQGRLGRPRGNVVFDLALRSIEPRPAPPAAPAHLTAPPKQAERTASGLAYRVIAKGNGKRRPQATSRVTIHYSGWTTDGKLFDSSVVRGHPSTVPLNRVIPGWSEGLQMMVEGDKYRFWIPEKLAYGKQPGGPDGMLVYEIELLKIAP